MKDRSKQFSRDTWKDPTRSLNRLKAVEKQLTSLFIKYRKRLLAELKPLPQHPFTQKEAVINECGAGEPGSPGFQPGNTCAKGGGALDTHEAVVTRGGRRYLTLITNDNNEETPEFRVKVWDVTDEKIKSFSELADTEPTMWGKRFPGMREKPMLFEFMSDGKFHPTMDEAKKGLNGLLKELSHPEPHKQGGPGSGNFGHEGRPGEVGGSGPGGSLKIDVEDSASDRAGVEMYKSRISRGEKISPVLVDKDDPTHVVDGNHRALAYRELDKSIPTVSVDRKDFMRRVGSGEITETEYYEKYLSDQPIQHTQKAPRWHATVDIKRFFQRLEDLSMEELIGPANAILEKEISDAYVHGTKYADINIKATMGVRLGAPLEARQAAWKKIGDMVIASQGEFKGVTDATNQQIRRVVSDGMINENNLSDVADAIQQVTEDIGENRARTIARTETMKAINTGVKDRYEKAGITRFERLEAADERVCDYCSSIDGQIFTQDEADEIDANMHPNCRGTWIISEESLAEDEEATQKQEALVHGGQGSGNFGHAGRPGEVGGSGPGGGVPSAKTSFNRRNFQEMQDNYDRIRSVEKAPETRPALINSAISRYSAQYSEPINKYLRSKYYDEFHADPDKPQSHIEIETDIASLDSAMERYSVPIPQGTEIWRGVGLKSGYDTANLEIGDICEDKAFQSFSIDPAVARSFSRPWVDTKRNPDQPQKTVIRAVMTGDEKALIGNHGEHEVIFPRGTRWQVVKKEVDLWNGADFNILTVMKHG